MIVGDIKVQRWGNLGTETAHEVAQHLVLQDLVVQDLVVQSLVVQGFCKLEAGVFGMREVSTYPVHVNIRLLPMPELPPQP